MKIISSMPCLGLIGVFIFFAAQVSNAQPPAASQYKLAWRDEFDGKKLDPEKWQMRSPGKRGDAFNDHAAISLDGRGCLVIRAVMSNGRLLSGMIHTEGIFSVRYGYFECRAKVNHVSGLWCSFWLQSSGNQERSTPEKDGAEIDIFEYFPHSRRDAVSHSMHWGGYGATHQVLGPVYSVLKPSADGFHVFGLLWSPAGYRIFVDGEEKHQLATHISKVPQFMVLSLEANRQVAGKYLPALLPDSFIVDYVRVYQQ